MFAIIDAISKGEINASAGVVISNNANAKALSTAAKYGIPHYHLSQTKLGSDIDLDKAILSTLKGHDVELVILSGYLRKLGQKTLFFYQNRILNIHPSLLPKFGGKNMHGLSVHEAVIASAEKESGASVHIVETEYDSGPVLAQEKVSIFDTDSPIDLANRIKSIETELFVKTVKDITSDRIKLPLAR